MNGAISGILGAGHGMAERDRSPKEVPGLSFFGQSSNPLVFPSVLAKASRDSFFHSPILGRFLSQFERQHRKGNCGARGAEGFRGRGGKGRGREGEVAKHSARVVPELVPEIVPE